MPIPSASHRVTNAVLFDRLKRHVQPGRRLLDFGAGRGHMVERLGDYAESQGLSPGDCLTACEVEPEVFAYGGVSCTRIGVDSVIPFEDATFDVVYSIEVIEHMRRPYDFMDEAYRVLKPGGEVVISTPNLLHIGSRLRQLATGFGDMYPPPSIDPANAGRICGHIMPLSYSYFDYGLRSAGFEGVSFSVDRLKRGAMVWAVVLWPVLKVGTWAYRRGLARYDGAVAAENGAVAEMVNSLASLCSRSCIVSARKRGG